MTEYLTIAEVLAMHEDQIKREGGAAGVRDQLLRSGKASLRTIHSLTATSGLPSQPPTLFS
jgi:hypothetical protein